MKSPLRVSLLLNGILSVALAMTALRYSWLLASVRDARPPGPSLTLAHDHPVYDQINGALAFTLPRGTALQESTPQGAATLGKTRGREYILLLRSDDSVFHPPSTRKDSGWMAPYRFDLTR